MTTSGSDFDAAKAVTDQLKGMDKGRQERILRWVAESLGLSASSILWPCEARYPEAIILLGRRVLGLGSLGGA